MAVTTEESVQVAATTKLSANQQHGVIRYAQFDFTQGAAAGDATSTAALVKLPAGKVRVLLSQSFVAFSAMGTATTMDLGHLAYVDQDGVDVAVDPNDLDDGVDVSSAGTLIPAGTLGGGENKEFSSRSGVTITAQFNDAELPIGGTLNGHFAYVVD